MNMCAVNRPLQLRPEAFDAVHARTFGRDIFAKAVIGHLMEVTLAAKCQIGRMLVSVYNRVRLHILLDERKQGVATAIGHNAGNDIPVALHHAENDRLRHHLADMAVLNTANEGFVHFNLLGETANRRITIDLRHVFANLMTHAPRRFVGHAKLALDFLCRNAITRSTKKEHNIEPVAQACAGPVEGCSSGRIDLRAAILTGIAATGLHAVKMGVSAAFLAIVTVAIANAHKVIEAAFLSGEAVLKLTKGRGFAHAHYVARSPTCRKGIIAFSA